MKLINAMLCLDCNEVFDPKESIVRDKYSCPKCANKSTVCLTSFFREEKKRVEVKKGGYEMTTKIIIVNEGPDNVEVAPTGQPTYTIEKGRHQSQYVFEGQDVNIKEVKVVGEYRDGILR